MNELYSYGLYLLLILLCVANDLLNEDSRVLSLAFDAENIYEYANSSSFIRAGQIHWLSPEISLQLSESHWGRRWVIFILEAHFPSKENKKKRKIKIKQRRTHSNNKPHHHNWQLCFSEFLGLCVCVSSVLYFHRIFQSSLFFSYVSVDRCLQIDK